MPPQAAKKAPLSIDDYLAGERDAETRHEYIDGEVYAMSGASRRHALVVTEVLSPGPERIDRHEKLLSSITLPSVQEVLRAAQDQPLLELHRRANGWKAERCDQGSLHLDCLDADLAVEQVYADVDWAQG